MWDVSHSFILITVQVLKHCKWMEQQATLCFLLKINTKGHTTRGCSTAMNSLQSLMNNCSFTVFSHAISINWWLAGNLPGALSHPFNQSYQISLEMIIRAGQPSCCPTSQGSLLLMYSWGLWQGLSWVTDKDTPLPNEYIWVCNLRPQSKRVTSRGNL